MVETREYAVPLTNSELLQAAELVGVISKKLQEKKDEFSLVREEFKESIRSLNENLKEQLDKLSSKRETREVTLRIEFNQPEEGKKRIFNNSTGELYEECAMTAEDWNNIFICEPAAKVLHPAETLNEDPDELEESELSGESEKTLDKCSVCGSRANIYHVHYGKEICRKCMLEMPQEKRVKEMLDSGHPFLFRACAGYENTDEHNDTTNFRFIDTSPEAQPKEPWKTRSWGMGIWRPGDYRKEGSEAYNFYMLLCCNPKGQEN